MTTSSSLVRGFLALAPMPVVVIWGDRDTITPLEQGQRLAGLVPGAQLLVLDGVGHIPQIEAPQRFNDLLLKVVDGLRRRIARSASTPALRRQVPAGRARLPAPAAWRRRPGPVRSCPPSRG
jgi:hypothetical protein